MYLQPFTVHGFLALAILGALWVTAALSPASWPYGTRNENECGLVARLRLNESITIHGFPPKRPLPRLPFPWSKMPCHNPYVCPSVAEECTLEFVSEGEDDCVLEFYSKYYERGDIRCEKQYVLIGDENKEKRICGFGVPPRLFRSSGNRFFLTHFRRDDNGQRTMSSYLDGVLRCLKGASATAPVVTCVPSSFPTAFRDTVNVRDITTSDGTPGTSNLNLTCTVDHNCFYNGTLCNVVGQPSAVESFTQQMPPPPSDCKRAVIPCANPGGCHWIDTMLFGTADFLIDQVNTSCTTNAGELCAHVPTFCLSNGV